MESSDSAREMLQAADRAAAAPWTDYPPTPWWYPPATGVWAGLLVLVIGQQDSRPALSVVGLVALIAVEFGFVAWYRRYRGTMPSSAPPEEFRAAMARLLLGAVAIGGLGWLLAHGVGMLAAATAVGVLVTVLITWYERAYAAAAAAARARLS